MRMKERREEGRKERSGQEKGTKRTKKKKKKALSRPMARLPLSLSLRAFVHRSKKTHRVFFSCVVFLSSLFSCPLPRVPMTCSFSLSLPRLLPLPCLHPLISPPSRPSVGCAPAPSVMIAAAARIFRPPSGTRNFRDRLTDSTRLSF